MSKPVSSFWWRWLLVVNLGVMLFGLCFVLIPDIMQDLFDILFFSVSRANESFSAEAVRYISFIYGVLGAVMIGWAVALLFIIIGPFRRGEREGWNAVTSSIVIWFVIDTSFSLYSGFVANAVLNSVFFVLFAIPLAATYQHFHGKAS